MKINMGYVVKGLAGLAICSVIMLLAMEPAQAVLEGNNRERLEYLNFSERLIKAGLYAKKGKMTFNTQKRRYVRGVKRHNEPRIYEPDVYTWELAMNEHKRKLQALAPVSDIPISNVAPMPMYTDGILPSDPVGNMPRNGKGDYKAEDIKRRIVEHMNSLDSKYPYNIPALQPAVYPMGSRGDSCDASYEN